MLLSEGGRVHHAPQRRKCGDADFRPSRVPCECPVDQENKMDMVEFASPEWIAALKELLVVYTKKAGPGVELSICEIFTGVPKHLDKHGNGVIAWHCRIKDGLVHFEETEIPEADVRTEVDYQFILPIAKKVYAPESMAEVEAYTAKGTAEGKMKSTSKDRSKIPPVFIGMHNDLAVRTL
jgi:hypothetical protein